MGKIYNNIFKKDSVKPKSTPLLQGAYEQGDTFVPNLSDQVMMQGLQTLGANAAKAYSNPRTRGEAQLNRAKRRDERSKKLRNQSNNKYTDPASKFNLKTAEIRKRGEDNIERANIDTKYKAWMINRQNTIDNNNSDYNAPDVDDNTPDVDDNTIDNNTKKQTKKFETLFSDKQIKELIAKRQKEIEDGKLAVNQVGDALKGLQNNNYNYNPLIKN